MTAVLTPMDKGAARQSGATLWRKQLLPVGEIDYKGRKIAFTREYLSGLVRAFNGRAYDQVPFQLADHANTHTNDPERFRGEVRGLEMTGDGLDIIISATDDGAALLQKNPALGVSARIVEDYSRADGRHFPAAIQHVLGTLDPRIPGMRPWQAVEAANDDDGEVIDLTALDFADEEDDPEPAPAVPVITHPEKEQSMALTADQEARLSRLLDLPEDQFDALLTAPAEDEAAEGDGQDDAEPTLTDAELEQLLAELPADDEPAVAAEPEPVLAGAGAALSNDDRDALELANAQIEELRSEQRATRAQLDRATYEKERDYFQRQFGVPARLTDLARSVLEGSGRTVELSNGATVDAGAIVRKLIGEFGKTMQSLGMSVELGNAEGADDTAGAAERAAEERAALVSGYLAANAL